MSSHLPQEGVTTLQLRVCLHYIVHENLFILFYSSVSEKGSNIKLDGNVCVYKLNLAQCGLHSLASPKCSDSI